MNILKDIFKLIIATLMFMRSFLLIQWSKVSTISSKKVVLIIIASILLPMVSMAIVPYISLEEKQTSQIKYKTWDVSLMKTFAQEVFDVYPEEWDEWQHWISDMMESRTRMQAAGMNHWLVSLITFYRLTRFGFHIGIDKVFILATRRATR